MSEVSPLTRLPIEALDYIFQYSARNELAQLIRVNHLLHDISIRILYRSIPELPDQQTIDCLISLCSNDYAASLVHKLALNWRGTPLADPVPKRPARSAKYKSLRVLFAHRITTDRRTLLNSALRRLRGLTDLTLFLDSQDRDAGAHGVFAGCTFALNTLVTSLACTPGLVAFLAVQPTLRKVNLTTGVNSSAGMALPPALLPNLQAFGWAQRDRCELVAAFLAGKPITRVSVVLHSRQTAAMLDMLAQSGCPVDYVSLTFRDALDEPLTALATTVPWLRYLRLTLTELPPQKILAEMEMSFSHLHALKWIDITVRKGACSALAEHMRLIVRKWLKACPSLCYVDFPQCGQRIQRVKL